MPAIATALYTKAPDDSVWSSDWNQLVNALTGASDPGPLAFAGQTASPGTAPGYTLQAGGVTSTGRKWAAYWITGGSIDGGGNAHRTGVTLLGTSTAAVALAAQEAVCTAPGSPPATAIGWGLCATPAGSGTFYVVAEAYKTYAGAWPSITDDLTDAQLTTAAPSSNTTGTTLAFPLQAGTDASKPTAGQKGRWYFATDTQRTYVDSGSAWVEVGIVNWSDLAGKPSLVNTFNGRSGAVVPTSGDYTAAEVGAIATGGNAGGLTDYNGGHTVYATWTGSAVQFKVDGVANEPVQQALTANSAASATSATSATTAGSLGGTLEVEVVHLVAAVPASSPYAQTTTAADAGANWHAEVNSVSSNATYYFEAVMALNNPGGTGTVQLWDVTAGAVVSGSSASTTSTSYGPARSGTITLVAGHVYSVAITATNSLVCNCTQARVIAKI